MCHRPWPLIGVLILAAGCAPEPASHPEAPAETYRVSPVAVVVDGEATTAQGALVTPQFFPAVGVRPIIGRLPADIDFAEGSTAVVVIGHELWASRFGEAPETIGRTIEVDGRSMVVVGVMPRGFEAPATTRLWIPDRR